MNVGVCQTTADNKMEARGQKLDSSIPHTESSDSAALAATTRLDLLVLKGANCTIEVVRKALPEDSLDASPLAVSATAADPQAAENAVEVVAAIVLNFLYKLDRSGEVQRSPILQTMQMFNT